MYIYCVYDFSAMPFLNLLSFELGYVTWQVKKVGKFLSPFVKSKMPELVWPFTKFVKLKFGVKRLSLCENVKEAVVNFLKLWYQLLFQ